jgi:hypothetical protein
MGRTQTFKPFLKLKSEMTSVDDLGHRFLTLMELHIRSSSNVNTNICIDALEHLQEKCATKMS